MSDRWKRARTSLWWGRCTDGSGWHMFSGSLEEMGAHVSRLHRESGKQHAARQVEEE